MHRAVQIPETAERLRVCIEITCGVAAGIRFNVGCPSFHITRRRVEMADQKRVGARERDGLVQMAGKALVGKCGIQLDAGHLIRGIQVNGVG